MFTLRQALWCAALCFALIAPLQASNNQDDDNNPTHTATTWNIDERNEAELQNVKRLSMNGLRGQLAAMDDKPKALALGAVAAQIFTERMGMPLQAGIIKAALKSSRPLSEYAALGSACKEHLFTKKMDEWDQEYITSAALKSSRPLSEYAALGSACKEHLFLKKFGGWNQACIMKAALNSSRPLSEYAPIGSACKEHLFTEKMRIGGNYQTWVIIAVLKSSRHLSFYGALGVVCKAHLFTENMDGWNQLCIIKAALPLSDTQLSQLVQECASRPGENGDNRRRFIEQRTKELLAEKGGSRRHPRTPIERALGPL